MTDSPDTQPMDPAALADRIVAIHTTLADLNAQAAKIVGVIAKARAQLSDVAGQRQDLITEIDQIMQPMLEGDWLDAMRAAEDITAP